MLCVNDKMLEFAGDKLMIKGELDEIYLIIHYTISQTAFFLLYNLVHKPATTASIIIQHSDGT